VPERQGGGPYTITDLFNAFTTKCYQARRFAANPGEHQEDLIIIKATFHRSIVAICKKLRADCNPEAVYAALVGPEPDYNLLVSSADELKSTIHGLSASPITDMCGADDSETVVDDDGYSDSVSIANQSHHGISTVMGGGGGDMCADDDDRQREGADNDHHRHHDDDDDAEFPRPPNKRQCTAAASSEPKGRATVTFAQPRSLAPSTAVPSLYTPAAAHQHKPTPHTKQKDVPMTAAAGGATTTITTPPGDTGAALPVVTVQPRGRTVLEWVGPGRYASASKTVDIGAFNAVREHTIIDHLGWQRVEVLTDTQCTVIARMNATQFLQVCATQKIPVDVIALKASQLAHEDVDRQIKAHIHSDEAELRRKRETDAEEVRLERNKDEDEVRIKRKRDEDDIRSKLNRDEEEEEERARRQLKRRHEEEQSTTLHEAKLLELLPPPAKILQRSRVDVAKARMVTQMTTLAIKTVKTWQKGKHTATELRLMFTHAFPTLSHEQFLLPLPGSDAVPEEGGTQQRAHPTPSGTVNHTTTTTTTPPSVTPEKRRAPSMTGARAGGACLSVQIPPAVTASPGGSGGGGSSGSTLNPFFLSPTTTPTVATPSDEERRDTLYRAIVDHDHRVSCGDRACLFQLAARRTGPADTNATTLCEQIVRIDRVLTISPKLRPDIEACGGGGGVEGRNWFIPTDLVPVMQQELLGTQPTRLGPVGVGRIHLPVTRPEGVSEQCHGTVIQARKAFGKRCLLTSVTTLNEMLTMLTPDDMGGDGRHGAALALMNAHRVMLGAAPQKRGTVNVYPCSHLERWWAVLIRCCRMCAHNHLYTTLLCMDASC
jgi:hypothetical protein